MNFDKRHFIIVVLFALTGLFNPRQILAGEDIQSKIDEYICAYEEINWFSGAILVVKDGKVLFEKGYGKADYENNIQNSPKTKFRICSLTKSFTAMAVMQLEQKGIVVVAVQTSKIDENVLSDWVKKHNIPFPVGMIGGDEEKTRFTWGVKALPWLILTDKEHIVRANGFALNELNEKLKQINGE